MRSRMTPEQLAEAKQSTDAANAIKALATVANGHGSGGLGTRAAQEEARVALVAKVGKRRADREQEAALQSAGARPKGWRRLLG